jgi:bacterial leucyl aminopeptidase
MKLSNTSLLALLLPAASARFVESGESNRVNIFPDGVPEAPKDTEKYHIELSPGNTKWVTEDEKWALRRVRTNAPAYSSSFC